MIPDTITVIETKCVTCGPIQISLINNQPTDFITCNLCKLKQQNKEYNIIKTEQKQVMYNPATDLMYIVDEIQELRMQQYLRDKEFLRTFRTDYTTQFLNFIKTKTLVLKEPISLSIQGDTRSGKSVSALYLACKIATYNQQTLSTEHVTANEFEFTEKLQEWIQCYNCTKMFKRPTITKTQPEEYEEEYDEEADHYENQDQEELEEQEELEAEKEPIPKPDPITICPHCKTTELTTHTNLTYLMNNKIDMDTTKIGVIKNSIFLIDEKKHTMFGTGSHSRRTKVRDIQNIIAVQNISTLWLTPDSWSNSHAKYGLITFGKSPYTCLNCKTRFPVETKTKDAPTQCPNCYSKQISPRTIRFMIYDLKEQGSMSKPFSMIYLPHFADVIPYGPLLEKEYLAKKLGWVEKEQTGQADVSGIQKKNKAQKYADDPEFQDMKQKERLVYITQKEGSEVTKSEVAEIATIATMIIKGYEI